MGKSKQIIAENVRIVDMGDQGMGIGKDPEGKVYLVQDAVPGDLMDIEVKKHRSRLGTGRPIKLTEASSWRTSPFCSHFGVCGGCKWQHMSYEGQLAYKFKNVTDALHRIGGVENPQVRPICGAPEDRYYRNKLEFSFGNSRWLEQHEIGQDGALDKNALGFHRPGSFEKIVEITHCYLQPEPSNTIRNAVRTLAKTRGHTFYDVKSHSGFLRNLIVRTSTLGQVMVTLVTGEDLPEEVEQLNQHLLNQFPEITTLFNILNPKKNDTIFDLETILVRGPGYILESIGRLQYRIGPKSFFQTNSIQARRLYGFVEEFAALEGHETIYDLYSGTGTIGLFLAARCNKVIGVEEIPEAVEDARLNADHNQIKNAVFHTGDVRKMLMEGLFDREGKPDCIVLDPPRAGLHQDILPLLVASGAPRIIYVSCNPATQARDLKVLCTAYEHRISQPVDMFPHTAHIENVTLLELKS